jgi:uracil-DNA glycosylase family 4
VIDLEVKGCTRCKELAAERTNTVFGVGDPNARICFFGEAPGADEDKQGEPFVGRAGKLLNKIIEACTFSREDVYILNVLKCRPPGNRNPSVEETCNCREYFERQLEVIAPEYIVCLGTSSAQSLLETKVSIGRLRGEFHDFHGIKVLATYHPAYLLRNPSAKKDVWEDMQFLMRDMGVDVPE